MQMTGTSTAAAWPEQDAMATLQRQNLHVPAAGRSYIDSQFVSY